MSEAYVGATSPQSLELRWRLGEIYTKENLAIGGDYPRTELAEQLFHSFGLMQIVAPFLPELITTDFPVLEMAQTLTNQMYRNEGKPSPSWKTPGFISQLGNVCESGDENVVTYSGGKDSMWNMMHAREAGGNPLAIHIKGLNQSVAGAEYKDVLKQQRIMKFPLSVLELTNSRSQKGAPTMRSRDIFLTALSIPSALDYHANKIFLEGSFFEGSDEAGKQFCYLSSVWESYNKFLEEAGLPVQMVGTNRGEIDSIRDLLTNHPDWMPLVSNCFTMTGLRKPVRNRFLADAPSAVTKKPSFPLYDSQCGRCLKCRTVNLTRVVYDPTMQDPSLRPDIHFFLKDTDKWLKRKRSEIADIIDPGFDDLLAQAHANLEV